MKNQPERINLWTRSCLSTTLRMGVVEMMKLVLPIYLHLTLQVNTSVNLLLRQLCLELFNNTTDIDEESLQQLN